MSNRKTQISNVEYAFQWANWIHRDSDLNYRVNYNYDKLCNSTPDNSECASDIRTHIATIIPQRAQCICRRHNDTTPSRSRIRRALASSHIKTYLRFSAIVCKRTLTMIRARTKPRTATRRNNPFAQWLTATIAQLCRAEKRGVPRSHRIELLRALTQTHIVY